MKKLKYIIFICLAVSIGFISGCDDALDVTNENQPDTERVLRTPEDAKSVVDGAMATWFQTLNGYANLIFDVSADQITTTNAWRNFWDFAKEPRIGYDNSAVSGVKIHAENIWEDSYAAITSANDVLRSIEDGSVDLGEDTQAYTAASNFVIGIGHAILAMTFDQAFIIPTDVDVDNLELKPYSEVMAFAIQKLDVAISNANSNTFTLNQGFISGVDVDNILLAQLANSMAARYLVAASRTISEDESVDWNKVLNYSNNGITSDVMPSNGGENSIWFNLGMSFAYFPSDMRVDQRILNMLDPNQPLLHPLEGAAPLLVSDDARAMSYFEWQDNFGWLRDTRGRHLFSSYTYTKYGDIDLGVGVLPLYEIYENDLLKAEALLRTSGASAEVATLINNSRVDNGELPALTGGESVSILREAIFYEREIELLLSSMGIGFSDMRRRDMLQINTILHLPVPAKELGVIQVPNYTFPQGGNDVSSGANAWK